MKIVLYNDEYKDDLEKLLLEFSKEVFGDGTCDVDSFVKYHWAIYLAIGSNGKVIGFSSFTINTYYGLRKPTVANDYLYVREVHRGGKATYLLSIQSGKVSIENNLPLENYYSSESSFRISSKLKGKKMYDAYIYEVGDVEDTLNKLKDKVKVV